MMTKEKAIRILAACVPLANKLATQGLDIELTIDDKTALSGFRAIWWDDWDFLNDLDLRLEVGLSPTLLKVLEAKAKFE